MVKVQAVHEAAKGLSGICMVGRYGGMCRGDAILQQWKQAVRAGRLLTR
jgi:hypothetical protein